MCLLGYVSRGLIVERYAPTVNDGVWALRAVVVGVVNHGLFRIGPSSSGIGVVDDLGDVLSERAVGVVSADERDAEEVVVQLEVFKPDRAKTEGEQGCVERDGRGAEVAVDPWVCTQHLGIQTRRGVDSVVAVDAVGFADACGSGVELGADLAQPAAEFARDSTAVETNIAGAVCADVAAEVDVLPVKASAPAQASCVLGEQ